MNLPDVLVPTYLQMLRALAAWLAKADAQLADGGGQRLLSMRLAPDMFPLATQVRFACAQACEGMFRLQGKPFPALVEVLLDEGRNAGEHPGTLAEACARISETVALVESLPREELDMAPESPIAHALPMGIVFDLSAEQYVRDWAIPQFYFHVMTAYAILRAQGIDLGKADYVSHMFGYARPGTLPVT